MRRILGAMDSAYRKLFDRSFESTTIMKEPVTTAAITARPIRTLRSNLLNGEFTAVELVQAHLDQIAETNEVYNSFIHVSGDYVLRAAAKADGVLKEQAEESPQLTGIPVALKDVIATKHCKTTAGSKILKNYLSPFDATVTSRLKEAGAIIIGKTNLDEFAMGSSSEYSAFGPVRNPRDISRVPGGTSGGSAVAVVTGQAPIALGTDTGGSIRQPAAMCGAFGLKPTYGRVSRYGSIAHASSFDQIGPLADRVEDLAYALQTIAGHDPLDSTSMDVPVPAYVEQLRATDGQDLRGLRVGIPKEYFIEGIDKEIEQSVQAALEKMSSLGAEIVEISLPHTEYALAAYYIITPAEASSNLSRYDGVHFGERSDSARSLAEVYEKTRSEGFGPEVKRRILIGTYVLSAGYYDAYYRKAQQARTLISDDFRAAFANHCDVIATPVTPTTAFPIGEKTRSPLEMYLADVFTVPVSLAGLPGLSMPIGLDSGQLPIGLQLIAPPFEETRLLSTAQILTAALQDNSTEDNYA